MNHSSPNPIKTQVVVVGAGPMGLAAGYRPTIDHVSSYLDCDAEGYPKLQRWRSTRNPSLFCIGFTYPTTEGFLQSVGRIAREAVAQIEFDT